MQQTSCGAGMTRRLPGCTLHINKPKVRFRHTAACLILANISFRGSELPAACGIPTAEGLRQAKNWTLPFCTTTNEQGLSWGHPFLGPGFTAACCIPTTQSFATSSRASFWGTVADCSEGWHGCMQQTYTGRYQCVYAACYRACRSVSWNAALLTWQHFEDILSAFVHMFGMSACDACMLACFLIAKIVSAYVYCHGYVQILSILAVMCLICRALQDVLCHRGR